MIACCRAKSSAFFHTPLTDRKSARACTARAANMMMIQYCHKPVGRQLLKIRMIN